MNEEPKKLALFPTVPPDRYVYKPGKKTAHVCVCLRTSPRPNCGGGHDGTKVIQWKQVPLDKHEEFKPCLRCLKILLNRVRDRRPHR